MVDVCAVQVGDTWYGLAHEGRRVVASATGTTRTEAMLRVERHLPPSTHRRFLDEPSEFAEATCTMMAELEAGQEEHKHFVLAEEHLPPSQVRVLKAAAAIPVGYVTSYGRVAGVAETQARVVGRVMATNPLYPIVPCHRVVGVDFALVGYGGSTECESLEAKLARLQAEARGFADERDIDVAGRLLHVFPVERVIEKHAHEKPRQGRLFDPREEE
jgi:O-6-methylguanine DNA methyltransferase